MNHKKYSLLLGADIIDDAATFSRIDDLDGFELIQLLNILLQKDIEILIRHEEG